MKKYDKVVKLDKDFKPIPDIDVLPKLPAGVYEVGANQNGEIYFSRIDTNHDQLVDLPNTEYDTVINEIQLFMQPSTKELFKEYGFVYKRSTLLYGPPGTGKTCIVNRIVQKVVEDNGIVLFSPNPSFLEESFKILDSLQPESRVMVIFEELDQLMARYESELLNLLDGEIQKNNVIYVATTNHIEKIPARIRRPGRFSSVIPVGFPTAETRAFYLDYKLKEQHKSLIPYWVEATVGFSIDELKETVLSVVCLDYALDVIVARIKENKGEVDPQPEADDEYRDDCYEERGPEKPVNYLLTASKKKR